MKHYWTILLTALLLVSCKKDEPEPDRTMKRVVVVYMAAENSLSPFANYDLEEIRKGMTSIPDSCQVVVYFDNASSQAPEILTFDSKNGEQVLYQYRNDPISTDSATMQQALAIIQQKCPARSYGLVMWSHASGWIPPLPRKAFGIDNGQNDSSQTTGNMGTEMEITTLANILQKSRMQWDYIFFDACFMQCVEVVYALRNAVKWCIGSPAEIPGNGAPYDKIMADMFLEPDEIWHIAEDYYEYYPRSTGVVLSVANTSEMEVLADATAQLLSAQSEYPVNDHIQRYNPNPDITTWKPEYFDMGSAMGQWYTETEYQTWRQAMELAFPYRYSPDNWLSYMKGFPTYPEIIDREHNSAMSMYIPVAGRSMNEYYMQTEWWKRVKSN